MIRTYRSKPEIRRPKAERRPKSEIRRTKARGKFMHFLKKGSCSFEFIRGFLVTLSGADGVMAKIRNPKAEGRKKSEIRNPNPETQVHEFVFIGVHSWFFFTLSGAAWVIGGGFWREV